MNPVQAARDPYKWVRLSSLASAGLLIVGCVGLWLVLSELSQLTRQNEVLEGTLRQTFRPLGVGAYSHDDPSKILLGLRPGESPDKFSFSSIRELKNSGQGLLIYLGSFSHLSTEEMDFRSSLLGGDIDTVNFDGMYSYSRRTPVLTSELTSTIALWTELPFERQYFFYTLFLYEDQDGGLYDTERLEVLNFKPPIVEGERLEVELEGGVLVRETYHYYTSAQRSRLGLMISELGHEDLGRIVGQH